MKRSCSYCGRIHDYNYDCPMKPKPKGNRDKDIEKFRGGKLWKAKRKEILERDKGLCVVCRLGIGCEPDLIPADSVHHIIPLADDLDRRLDDDNLISLCAYHHEVAERGEIPAADLLRAIGTPPPGVGGNF